jgi:hypothetical protein
MHSSFGHEVPSDRLLVHVGMHEVTAIEGDMKVHGWFDMGKQSVVYIILVTTGAWVLGVSTPRTRRKDGSMEWGDGRTVEGMRAGGHKSWDHSSGLFCGELAVRS